MTDPHLFIRLHGGRVHRLPGRPLINQYHGGPETLLRWLETQLGLPARDEHPAYRTQEMARILDDAVNDAGDDAGDGASFSRSFAADRWSTAAELLARYDHLKMYGWDGAQADGMPTPVRELAEAMHGRSLKRAGVPERLERVLACLSVGQKLPEHSCTLYDPIERWPAAWQRVLTQITTNPAGAIAVRGTTDSQMRRVQDLLLGTPHNDLDFDDSFRAIRTRSTSAAAGFIAATLSKDGGDLTETVICCEDDDTAVRIDAALERFGLPTTGATAASRTHPTLRILSLAIALCRDPVDPQLLSDFLTIPDGPIPRHAGRKLAKALEDQPGLGSRSWDKAETELTGDDADRDGNLRSILDAWVYCDRIDQGAEMSTELLRRRCSLVADWATRRVKGIDLDDAGARTRVQAFRLLAHQATLLAELAPSDATLPEAQLERLIDEVSSNGVDEQRCIEAAGGPTRVRSLAEIDQPYSRLIWVGVGTEGQQPSHWSVAELQHMKEAGIAVDDGTHALQSLREAEARGFCLAADHFLAVEIPSDGEKRWHPIWSAVHASLREELRDLPILEGLITDDALDTLQPFAADLCQVDIEPAPALKTEWQVPPGLLTERDRTSVSALDVRLGCPLKWTLRYGAQLRQSPVGAMPSDVLLKGRLCHDVLARTFNESDPPTDPDDVLQRVRDVFDERLRLDAAPLAIRARKHEADGLRDELVRATGRLLGALKRGGYSIVRLEYEIEGEVIGTRLTGRIDCLVRNEDDEEAIIDFKYGGHDKYQSLLEKGRATQPATYAHARANHLSSWPAFGYLILSDNVILTPSGSRLDGSDGKQVVEGDSLEMVWNDFERALGRCSDWLTDSGRVPVRPLQEPDNLPPGVEIVLEEPKKNEEHQICRYCDYKIVCGLREVV